MRDVREERTGWRDEKISARHRKWGWNCPCVDLDFVVIEYNYSLPVALIEYKDKHAKPPILTHPTYQALKALADGYVCGPLPFFIAIYCSDKWSFRIIPLNAAAENHYRHCLNDVLSEQRFVCSLYKLRKKTLFEADTKTISMLNDITC